MTACLISHLPVFLQLIYSFTTIIIIDLHLLLLRSPILSNFYCLIYFFVFSRHYLVILSINIYNLGLKPVPRHKFPFVVKGSDLLWMADCTNNIIWSFALGSYIQPPCDSTSVTFFILLSSIFSYIFKTVEVLSIYNYCSLFDLCFRKAILLGSSASPFVSVLF